MALKFVKQLPQIKWPVTVNVPVDGGKTQESEFTAVFKPISKKEYDQMVKDESNDEKFISTLLVGWEGLQDEDGNDIPYDPSFIPELVQFAFVRTAILTAYHRMSAGVAEKN